MLKKEALGYLCHKLPVQLGIAGDATWLSDLRVSLADQSAQGDGLAWCNRLTPAQVRYVAFAQDLLYGIRHDGQTVADTFPGLSEALDDVKSLLATEDSSESDADLEDSIPAPPAESGDQKDRKKPRGGGDQVY